ncbi:hypothetical protein DSO57_1002003 [Entomophthora muscae]|uniref:Uncharacterized protein n=1 Tax=Entomophthora muscae TaxID=34485 RepID=A0ACC2RNU3_9FUNG|nr:hypothetical protein DSO57_1002003 [Entomophthora muscae]
MFKQLGLVLRNAKNSLQATPTRFQSTTATVASPIVTKPASKPRMSAFRGGSLGFLLGSVIAGGSGYYFLINDYQIASGLLLTSVKELQFSTEKVREYARKIELVSADLEKLKDKTAKIEQLEAAREEMRKLFNANSVEYLELKKQLEDLEKDIHGSSKPHHL